MIDAQIRSLIDQIHASPVRLALATTGGGAGAIAKLLGTPGGSRTLIEAVVPYAATALADYLKTPPDQACSEPTARAMAMAAFERARRLAGEYRAEHLAGVGATASLVTDRPKRGPHRVHVAMQTPQATRSWSLELTKGQRDRAGEEAICTRLILSAAAEACGAGVPVPLDLLPGEEVQSAGCEAPAAWRDLLLGRREKVLVGQSDSPPERAIFPGAFNPLHAGHREMARLAAEQLSLPVGLEISLENVDKSPLDFCEIQRRLAALGDWPVWLTRAATFEQKAALFPGAVFLVGVDTLARIADPRYYGNQSARMHAAMEKIAAQGCSFLVFGRAVTDGRFRTLADLKLPEKLRSICRQVPAEMFRQDVSSTAMRQAENYENSAKAPAACLPDDGG